MRAADTGPTGPCLESFVAVDFTLSTDVRAAIAIQRPTKADSARFGQPVRTVAAGSPGP